tara:strand:+ start:6955 stop:7422 length:468 start_codon:yes stop_codon:yes gene_type:complete
MIDKGKLLFRIRMYGAAMSIDNQTDSGLLYGQIEKLLDEENLVPDGWRQRKWVSPEELRKMYPGPEKCPEPETTVGALWKPEKYAEAQKNAKAFEKDWHAWVDKAGPERLIRYMKQLEDPMPFNNTVLVGTIPHKDLRAYIDSKYERKWVEKCIT